MYHPLVIFYLAHLFDALYPAGHAPLVAVYAAVFVATVGVAHLSYLWVERPFLTLKDRFALIKSKSTD